MLNRIISAIRGLQVLTVTYNGHTREVEPHAVGSTKRGNDVMRCYQVRGQHEKDGHEWDLLTLDKIQSMRASGRQFAGPRADYKRDDKAMAHIYAQL